MSTSLHLHEPSSLLPLLRTRLPYSIGLVNSILCNPTPSASSPIPALTTTYATFTPNAFPGDGDDSWLVVVILPSPSEQMGCFHALEAVPEGSRTDEAIARAGKQVASAMLEMLVRHPDHPTMGGLHTLWGPAVLKAIDSEDLGNNTVYLAPEGVPSSGFSNEGVDLEGLVVDGGQPGDEHIIFSTNQYNGPEYYRARSEGGYMTVVRPATAGSYAAPVSWILTHSNGSQGALYTMPQYRRRGLAQFVTATRLAAAPPGLRSFVYVTEGNSASEALWESRGWTKGWEVTWAR